MYLTRNKSKRVYVYIPETPMTSICEGQPLKTRPFPSKTRVIWVLSIYIYVYIYMYYIYTLIYIYIYTHSLKQKHLAIEKVERETLRYCFLLGQYQPICKAKLAFFFVFGGDMDGNLIFVLHIILRFLLSPKVPDTPNAGTEPFSWPFWVWMFPYMSLAYSWYTAYRGEGFLHL